MSKVQKVFTDDEQIRRVWDVENIKKLMHRRVYYISGDLRREELAELWVSEPDHKKTASFGRNWGYYVGMDEIERYYITAHEKRVEKQMKENGASEPNVGNIYAHPLSTGLVEVALDGKTAKGLWYSIAQETLAKPDGTAEARWHLEKTAADFVREAGDWKIWHLVIATDLSSEAGEDYSEQPVYDSRENNPVWQEFGTPTIEVLTHDTTFNWWDDYPPMPPKDYETFTDAISYGPEGFLPPKNKGLGAGEGRNYK